MFGKLLKHEWRASRGLVGYMCGIIGLSGLLAGGSMRYMLWSVVTDRPMMVSAYTFVLVAAVLAVLGCCVLSMYLLAYRFYKSRFTDQGYLMLTLPVTTHEHLLASIANTVIGVALVSMMAVVAAAVATAGYLAIFEEASAAAVWQIWADASTQLGEDLGMTRATMILDVPKMLLSFLSDLILFMLALTIGAQVDKHPVLYGTVVYIAANELVSGACDLIGKQLGDPLLASGISCVLYGILAVAAYCIMHHIIDKRLKLV